MALLLNIDTATETASACLTDNGSLVSIKNNTNQREHASFLHPAIEALLQETGRSLAQVDAVAVTAGPGSYTGIRVGLAAAKGICYALQKPLITVNTLEVMTVAAMASGAVRETLFCPMIDARRMEVFAAVYQADGKTVVAPAAMLLDANSFGNILTNNKVLFFGSGSEKFKVLLSSANALFGGVFFDARHVGVIAETAFAEKKFSDVSYSEPTYLKEFFSTL